jgi:hypothetical protein
MRLIFATLWWFAGVGWHPIPLAIDKQALNVPRVLEKASKPGFLVFISWFARLGIRGMYILSIPVRPQKGRLCNYFARGSFCETSVRVLALDFTAVFAIVVISMKYAASALVQGSDNSPI